jgi:hypothetical protein
MLLSAGHAIFVYKLLFNDQEMEGFITTWGLRQGLSSALAHEEEVPGIEGVQRNAPSVSHLLFADDSLTLLGNTLLLAHQNRLPPAHKRNIWYASSITLVVTRYHRRSS